MTNDFTIIGHCEPAPEYRAAEQKRRNDLVFAMRSRILNDEEMGEVAEMGIMLYVRYGEGYSENELIKRLNEDLLQQFRLKNVEVRK